jgi:hypothetical protein
MRLTLINMEFADNEITPDGDAAVTGQWITNGSAAYPLTGAPIMTPEQICALYSVPDKKMKEMSLSVIDEPQFSTADAVTNETAVERSGMTFNWLGIEHVAFFTSEGVKLINAKDFAPITEDRNTLYFERRDANGRINIAVKRGLLLEAVIFPIKVSSGFCETVTRVCEGLRETEGKR